MNYELGCEGAAKGASKSKINGRVASVFKRMLPYAAAAMIMVMPIKAAAENELNATFQNESVASIGRSVSTVLYEGGNGSTKYGVMNSMITRTNSQTASISRADSCLETTENKIQVGENIIQQSVAITLDKVEQGFAYITMTEIKIDSMGGGGGSVDMDDTTKLVVKIGDIDSNRSAIGESTAKVPSIYVPGVFYTVTVLSADSSLPEATIKFSKWIENGEAEGNVNVRSNENRVLGYIGENRGLGRGWLCDGKLYLGYTNITLDAMTPIGDYSKHELWMLTGGTVQLQKSFGRLNLIASGSVMGGNGLMGSLSEQNEAFSASYRWIEAGVLSNRSSLAQRLSKCMECADSGVEIGDINWALERASTYLMVKGLKIKGIIFGVGIFNESERDRVTTEITTRQIGGGSTVDPKSATVDIKDLTTEADSLYNRIVITGEKGNVSFELGVGNGNGSSKFDVKVGKKY